MSDPPRVRPGTRADLPGIFAIYDHAILHTVATFDLEAFTPAQRDAWFEQRFASGENPLLVAEGADGAILGYAYSVPFRWKPAYARTHEVTVYVAPSAHRRGVAKLLYAHLIAEAERLGLHVLVAVLAGDNPASEALHRSCGFEFRGSLPEVGHKFGAWVDVHMWTREVGSPSA